MWTDYWPIILLHVEYDRQLAWYCRLSDEVYCVLKIGVYTGLKLYRCFRGGDFLFTSPDIFALGCIVPPQQIAKSKPTKFPRM